VLVSLLLGLGLRAVVEGQSTRFAVTTGVTVRYPEGWLRRDAQAGVLLQVRDPEAESFHTRYEVRAYPISAGTAISATLGTVLTNRSLTQAQDATAYRVLEVRPGDDLKGMPTMEQIYAYVAENYDPFAERLPVVVSGLDIALARGDQALVFTLLAEQDQFREAETQFRRFLGSVEFD
jgi:hypothetical protein